MWSDNGLASEHLQPNFPKNVWRSLHRHLCRIDPNWCTAYFIFDEKCEIIRAFFNGPKFGDFGSLVKLPKLLRGQFLERLKTYMLAHPYKSDIVGDTRCGIKFYNPSYKIELINGRTEIVFEHCVEGVVQNYNPQKQTFEIQNLRDMVSGKSEMMVIDGQTWNQSWKRTMQELKRELKDDGPNFQATEIYYLPPK